MTDPVTDPTPALLAPEVKLVNVSKELKYFKSRPVFARVPLLGGSLGGESHLGTREVMEAGVFCHKHINSGITGDYAPSSTSNDNSGNITNLANLTGSKSSMKACSEQTAKGKKGEVLQPGRVLSEFWVSAKKGVAGPAHVGPWGIY